MLRIAVRMLLGDPTKWMGVVFGVLVCTFLITHMLSMFHGMMERSYALVTDIPQADVWVMDADDGQIRQDTRSLADPRTKAIFAAKPARPVCVAVRA